MYNRLILDTHIFLWSVFNSPQLSQKAKDIVEEHSNRGMLSISQMSVWEVFMVAKNKRIRFNKPVIKWVEEVVSTQGFSVIPMNNEILHEAVFLENGFHKDPADRIIVATARCTNSTLMTKDKQILSWARLGHIKYMEA